MKGDLKDEGRVLTVTGSIDPQQLGTCAIHEHILWGLDYWTQESSDPELKPLYKQPVTLELHDRLMDNPTFMEDNLRQISVDVGIAEAAHFKAAGGGTIVEASCIGVGRHPLGLRVVSETTGLNVVASTGLYVDGTVPTWVDMLSIDQLAEVLVGEIRDGIVGTGVRPGVMSDVGTSEEIRPSEEKQLRACARAHLATGAGIGVHTDGASEVGNEILDILIGEGVRPERIVIEHVDERTNPEYHLSMAERGALLEFDTWGLTSGPEVWGFALPPDSDRVRVLKALLDQGYVKQLLLSLDVANKHYLKSFGGGGYARLLEDVVPMLLENGITQDDVQTMLVENPKRWLPLSL